MKLTKASTIRPVGARRRPFRAARYALFPVNQSSTDGRDAMRIGLDINVEICQILSGINGRKVAMMTLTSHLTELSEKHKLLERKLEEALTHPSVDSLEISSLKREKLKLKDEIAKLKQDRRQH